MVPRTSSHQRRLACVIFLVLLVVPLAVPFSQAAERRADPVDLSWDAAATEPLGRAGGDGSGGDPVDNEGDPDDVGRPVPEEVLIRITLIGALLILR